MDTRRDKSLRVRVSSDEKRRFEAMAKRAGLPLSAWVRVVLLKRK